MAETSEKSGVLSVWLDRELITRAKQIATSEGTTVRAVIERAARAAIDRQYTRFIARTAAELGGES
jgi:predicted transcriptional regulator